MGDGPGLADDRSRGDQLLDDPGPGLGDRAPDQLAVVGGGRRRVLGRPALGAPLHREQGSVTTDDRPGGEGELAPPEHVGRVAEGADHGDPRALLRVCQLVGQHRHPDPEQGGGDVGAEQGAEAVVVGVGDQGHAGGQQLGPGGLDLHVPRRAGTREAQPMVGAGALAVLELGLADRGPEVDVPEGRGVRCTTWPRRASRRNAALGDPPGALGDGRVGVRPVDGEPERAPQLLEDLLVLRGELLAERDEVGSRDRDRVLAAAASGGTKSGS